MKLLWGEFLPCSLALISTTSLLTISISWKSFIPGRIQAALLHRKWLSSDFTPQQTFVLVSWRKFSYCQYPFILSLSAKKFILQHDSQHQMLMLAKVSGSLVWMEGAFMCWSHTEKFGWESTPKWYTRCFPEFEDSPLSLDRGLYKRGCALHPIMPSV